jgi:hypothetical protein
VAAAPIARARTGRARRVAHAEGPTAPRARRLRSGYAAVIAPARCVSVRAVNEFHVLGGLLALWAVIVSFLGITREGFPGSKGVERAIAAISVILVALAIGSAITSAASESEEEHGSGEEAALVTRS